MQEDEEVKERLIGTAGSQKICMGSEVKVEK